MGRGRTSEPAWQERLPDLETQDLWATLVRGGASSTLLTVVDDEADLSPARWCAQRVTGVCPPSCKILTRINHKEAASAHWTRQSCSDPPFDAVSFQAACSDQAFVILQYTPNAVNITREVHPVNRIISSCLIRRVHHTGQL